MAAGFFGSELAVGLGEVCPELSLGAMNDPSDQPPQTSRNLNAPKNLQVVPEA